MIQGFKFICSLSVINFHSLPYKPRTGHKLANVSGKGISLIRKSVPNFFRKHNFLVEFLKTKEFFKGTREGISKSNSLPPFDKKNFLVFLHKYINPLPHWSQNLIVENKHGFRIQRQTLTKTLFSFTFKN